MGSRLIDTGIQQTGRAADDVSQFADLVKLKSRHDAKSIAQRIGQHARPGSGAYQSEGLKIEFDRSRARALADHDVDLIVLKRRVKNFFDNR